MEEDIGASLKDAKSHRKARVVFAFVTEVGGGVDRRVVSVLLKAVLHCASVMEVDEGANKRIAGGLQ